MLLRTLLRHHSLLLTLTVRELKARYRGSVLGFFWSLVNPVMMLVVYTFVFSYIFTPRDPDVAPYALFLVTGLFPWIWFQTSLTEGAASLMANAALIRKAAFPAELLPIVPVLANLVHLALALPVIAVAFVVFRSQGHDVSGWTALLLPLIILVQVPLTAGLSLGLAALNAHFKDVKDLLANLLTLLFFLTPILYSLRMVSDYPAVRWVVEANPLSPYVLALQEAVFYGQMPEPWRWATMALVSLIGWLLGAALFDRLRDTLVEAV
ncbi:MAG: ABC transporter permease [Acidobacteriota bacterium]